MVVGHFSKFVWACLEAFCQIVTERKQLDQVLDQEFDNDIFSSVDESLILLEYSNSFS